MRPNDTRTTKLLPLGSMALLAGVPTPWLRDEAKAGRIPHLEAGSRLLFDPDVIIAMLEERAAGVPQGRVR